MIELLDSMEAEDVDEARNALAGLAEFLDRAGYLDAREPLDEALLAIQSGSTLLEPTYDNGGSRFAFSGSGYYLKQARGMHSVSLTDEMINAVIKAECDAVVWIEPSDPKGRCNPEERESFELTP